MNSDRKHMEMAFKEAEKSQKEGCVPIGAVIVDHDGKVICRGHNQIRTLSDITAHAEAMCMRKAGQKVFPRLYPKPTTLYTTVEPCFSCGFFATRTNIKKIIWALNDSYRGGMDHLSKSYKLKSDIGKMKIIREPFKDLKEVAKKLMYEYHVKTDRVHVAKHFK